MASFEFFAAFIFYSEVKGHEALSQNANNKQFGKFLREYVQRNDATVKQLDNGLKQINNRFDELMALLTATEMRSSQTAGAFQPAAAGTADPPAANPPVSQQATAVSNTFLQPVYYGPTYSNEIRHPDGSINFDIRPASYSATADEERVLEAWPNLMMQAAAESLGRCKFKNRVIIPNRLRLKQADKDVFRKLSEIQRLLQMALIPYDLWV
jgi:hypothetical protein